MFIDDQNTPKIFKKTKIPNLFLISLIYKFGWILYNLLGTQ